MTEINAEGSKFVQLKREVGLFSAVSLILNKIIRAGIFVTPGIVYKFTGSVALCLIMWAIAGVMSLLGALIYVELASLVPRSGGAYSYIQKAFSPLHAFWGPLPAFCSAFLEVLVLMPCYVSICMLTFSDYFLDFLSNFVCIEADDLLWGKKLIAMILICVITFMNAWSVNLFLKVQNAFTIIKVLICLLIIGGGLYHICSGNTEHLQTGFEGSTPSAANLSIAFVYGMFAFGGWSSVIAVADEVKKPEVNVLRSILIALPLVTVLYILLNISYMSVLTYDQVTDEETVAMIFSDKVLSWFTSVVPMAVAITLFGTTMAIQFTVTRLSQIAAEFEHVPEIFSFLHVEYLTPYTAILAQGIMSLILVAANEITTSIQFYGFTTWLMHALCVISAIILRKTMPDNPRTVKVPIIFLVLFLLISICGCVVTVAVDLDKKYIVALGLVLNCIFIYYFHIYKKVISQWTVVEKFIRTIQSVLLVAPTKEKQL